MSDVKRLFDILSKLVTRILPISLGGTGATSKEDALYNLGGMRMEEVWTNPSPTSSFAAQTVSLDLSEYDRVRIEYRSSYSSAYHSITECVVGAAAMLKTIGSSSSKIWGAFRSCTVSSTGVTFTAATSLTPSSAASSTAYLIPTRIYGIKLGGVVRNLISRIRGGVLLG